MASYVCTGKNHTHVFFYVCTQKWAELEQEHIHYTYERTFRQNTYVNVLSWTLDMYKAIHTKHFIYTLCIFSVFSLVLNIVYGITYLQDYSNLWNIAKSNKSELWNRLSYRGLPYLFEVRSQTLFYDFQKFEVAASKFRGWFSFDLNHLERPNWELKKNVMG